MARGLYRLSGTIWSETLNPIWTIEIADKFPDESATLNR
jgi:hypothetical protein